MFSTFLLLVVTVLAPSASLAGKSAADCNTGSCCPAPIETQPPVENSLAGYFSNLFNTGSYPARWNCGEWTPLEGWIHIISDVLIAISYFSIPLLLVCFIRRRPDLPVLGLFWLFAGFIVTCGTVHLLEAVIFYYPLYRVAGLVKLATAVISVCTVIAMLRVAPVVMDLPFLVERNRELRAADQAKTAFLANMSHEIRTPMTAIMGFCEVLRDPASSTKQRHDAIATIERNSSHLLHIINDILDLSKVESGKIEMDKTWVDLHLLLADVKQLLTPRAIEQSNTIRVRVRSGVPRRVYTDPTRLKQALLNLVGNAIKFTRDGIIECQCSYDSEANQIAIEVVDSGIGMSPEQLEKIFEPFTQADASTTRKFGGTGLGLTISREIARVLGGDLTATSIEGSGSHFHITFAAGPVAQDPIKNGPISDGDAQAAAAHSFDPTDSADPMELTDPASSATDTPLSGRVLVVEDGLDNQRLIKHKLKKLGLKVTLAENGKIGFELALAAWDERRPFDLIIMDVQMPVMDGYTATRKLREEGYPGQLISLTASAMEHEVEQCFEAGCDAYLSKPIDHDRFVKEVGRRVRLAKAQSQQETVIGS